MSKSDNSFIIAITGASGAGKMSVVNEVTVLLDDAVSFYFDEYSETHQKPENIEEWVKMALIPTNCPTSRAFNHIKILT